MPKAGGGDTWPRLAPKTPRRSIGKESCIASELQHRCWQQVAPDMDEVSDMDDIAQTVAALQDSVDWVIVRNPVKIPTTKFFQGSELEAQLLGFGAEGLEIPALLSDTRNHLRSREIQIGRGLSPAEALKNEAVPLDMAHRIVLEQWLAACANRLSYPQALATSASAMGILSSRLRARIFLSLWWSL